MSDREQRRETTTSATACRAPAPSSHHDGLRLALMEAGRQVRAGLDDPELFPAALDGLVRFCLTELLPHLEADERWLPALQNCSEKRLLAAAMRTEARAMAGAVNELVAARSACEAVTATRVLHALLAAHAHHEQLLGTVGENR